MFHSECDVTVSTKDAQCAWNLFLVKKKEENRNQEKNAKKDSKHFIHM